LAEIKAQRQDVPGALDVLHRALARGNAIPAGDRALIQLEDATLRHDSDARLQALSALAQADPYDPQVWRDLAGVYVSAHRYPQAVEVLRKVIAIDPGDPALWNELAYAAAYSGQAAASIEAAEHYRALQPRSPNPLDSLGDVKLIAGRLADAEKDYRESAKMDPQFLGGLDLLKAAMAHLMTGDVPGADALAQDYFDARAKAKDALVDYHKAEWAWIGGRRKPACRQMEQVAKAAETAGSRDIAAHAYAELAIWNLLLGDRDAAAQAAQKAAGLATPASAVPVTLARFLSQPPATAAEWQARADKLAPNPALAPLRAMALADALLIAGEFEAARPILQQMYDGGNPTADEGLPVLLAWADAETGHIPEAAALVRFNQPLSDAGLNWSTPLHFPRIYEVRAVVAGKQGKADEARENQRIYRALSGGQ
jgi:tetratricopeptide (TPR) repeat protein